MNGVGLEFTSPLPERAAAGTVAPRRPPRKCRRRARQIRAETKRAWRTFLTGRWYLLGGAKAGHAAQSADRLADRGRRHRRRRHGVRAPAGGDSPHPVPIHASAAAARAPVHAIPSQAVRLSGDPGGRRARRGEGQGGGACRRGHRPGAVGPRRGHRTAHGQCHQGDDGPAGAGKRQPRAGDPGAEGGVRLRLEVRGETAALHPGDVLTAQQLLAALLLPSGADAAYTLANAYGPGLNAFVARMNATAARMGMSAYPFHLAGRAALSHRDLDLFHPVRPAHARPRGDAVPGLPVHRGPVVLPPAEGARASPVLVGQHRRADRLLSGRRGIKTGYTDDAGHCLLFEAIRNGRTLIGVVLDSPATGPAAAVQDAERMLNWGFRLPRTGSTGGPDGRASC